MDHLANLSLGSEFRPMYFGENLFDPSIDEFHSFPDTHNYKFNDRDELQPLDGGIELDHFLQSWLFFGLLATVIQLPHGESHSGDFVSEDRDQIDTRYLGEYLGKWRSFEISHEEGRTLRMIRAQIALDRAREVVRNHCSSEGKFYRPGQIHPNLSLSLMVLGETLTNAKSKIVEEISFNIQGWHGDATEGWGTSACVLEKMKLDGWCPRTLHVLKGQLKSSATSMLSAYKSHNDFTRNKATHENCTAEEPCQVTSVDQHGEYETRHHIKCEKNECQLIGPSVSLIIEEIEKDNFPLLVYEQGVIQVRPYKAHEKYAIISHVWADGYGNPSKNQLWECQLKYFQKLFNKMPGRPPGSPHTCFWIDTLAIPVEKEHKLARQRAIRKIHDIYTHARYTVVIDNGLTQMGPDLNYENTAMKILASGWMRRLWTLQEAYLSRRLFFAFKDEQLKNLDDLEDQYPKASDILTSNIPTAARNYFHSMLGPDRNARINHSSSKNGYGLLASVWRAAQWRTTSHMEHETLALATLLNVEYQEAISKAGLTPEQKEQNEARKLRYSRKELDEMMLELWKTLDETCSGSIPSGIIFLPGDRISLKGYGWAPRSWMTGQPVEYPDPLSIMTSPATLTGDKGLGVTYPGILLHTSPGASILNFKHQGDRKKQEFHFTIDSSLLEWYVVEWDIENIKNSPLGTQPEERDLAIILCRPRPRELPEVALLVEISRTIRQRSLTDQRQSNIYHVFILCRVKIRREIKESSLSDWKISITQTIANAGGKIDELIIGEVLAENQQWFVDGRPVATEIPEDVKATIDSHTDREKAALDPAKTSKSQKKPFTQSGHRKPPMNTRPFSRASIGLPGASASLDDDQTPPHISRSSTLPTKVNTKATDSRFRGKGEPSSKKVRKP